MSNQKSIIGCGYIPRNALAVCLKTKAETKLGEVVYKIIKDPYERMFGYRDTPWVMVPCSRKYMAVDVLDANTGLTYAVEYKPANLVRSTPEPKNDQSGESVDFVTRTEQISKELEAMFDHAEGGISDKCGVAFFAISDDGNDKTPTCVGFLGGRGDRVSRAIASACFQPPQILEIVKHASIEAMFRRVFDIDNKKK